MTGKISDSLKTILGVAKLFAKKDDEVKDLKKQLKIHGLRQLDEYVKLKQSNKQLKKDLELSLDKFQTIADKYLNLKQKLEKTRETE